MLLWLLYIRGKSAATGKLQEGRVREPLSPVSAGNVR